MCPSFYLGPYLLYSYDVLLILGFSAAAVYFYVTVRRTGVKNWQILLFLFLDFFVQQWGGSVVPFLYNYLQTGTAPNLNIYEKSPGHYFHSVFLCELAFLLIYMKAFGWPTKKVLDRFLVAVIIASAIGRIGCFLNDCCGGKPSSLAWGIVFPNSTQPVYPTQVYMFFAETALVIYLLKAFQKIRYDGEIFWKGIFVYSIWRFFIEFYRTNPAFFAGLTHAQVFSAATFLLSAIVLRRNLKTRNACS